MCLASTGLCNPSSERDDLQDIVALQGPFFNCMRFLSNKEEQFEFHCFTGIASLCGKIFANAVSCVTEIYSSLELFCRTLKDTWFISEYFLWVVSFKVNGPITRKVTFFTSTSLCRFFLVPLFVVLPALQDLCAKIKWCCFSVVLYGDLCHLPFLVVRSWCGRMHLGFVFWDS